MKEKILTYITEYYDLNKYPPSLAEIANHCGCTLQNIADNYVHKIEQELSEYDYYRRIIDMRKKRLT